MSKARLKEPLEAPHALEADFEDFFAHALIGLAIATPAGRITRANPRLAQWLGYEPAEIEGGKFSDYLTVAGRVYYETHLRPLLRLQGFFDEIALELSCKTGERFPVIVNAVERRDSNGEPLFLRITVAMAADRRKYERELLAARAAEQGANAELRRLNGELEQRIDLEMRDRLSAEGNLMDERTASGLREQFIAVLGHDLRNPLASISGIGRLLAKRPPDDKADKLCAMLDSSVARMAGLIDDVMDFARGRLGGGLSLNPLPVSLQPVLQHVVDELRTAWPQRTIEAEFDLPNPVNCDAARLAQLLSNLIANALTHGGKESAVRVSAKDDGEAVEVAVANTGKPIPAAAIARLFQPFTRDEVRPSQQGLGLGLYIVSEIARAHGGQMSVISSEQETRFVFRMPTIAPAG